MSDASSRQPSALVNYLRTAGARDQRLLHVEEIPGRSASRAPWPDFIHPEVVSAYSAGGASLWSHQEEALRQLHAGKHVVIATGTGSGKSLPAWVPILSDLMDTAGDTSLAGYRSRPSALYLAPTKALGADQLESLNKVAATYQSRYTFPPPTVTLPPR